MLRWDLSGIHDWETVCWRPLPGGAAEIAPITYGLILAPVLTGIPNITRRNQEEVWRRLRLLAAMDLTPLALVTHEGSETYRFSGEDVARHVGLRTEADRRSELWFERSIKNRLWISLLERLNREDEVERALSQPAADCDQLPTARRGHLATVRFCLPRSDQPVSHSHLLRRPAPGGSPVHSW